MAIILQQQLFSFKDLENIEDLQRLKLVIENIPDENLIKKLTELRSKGRNDYLIRALWNSILAGIVFQHNFIESLRRELLRNFQLKPLHNYVEFTFFIFNIIISSNNIKGVRYGE